VDIPNWAHDLKTQNLARALGNDYDIRKRYETEVTPDDLNQADLIVVYFWLQFRAMESLLPWFERNRDKLLVGICSHWELEDERRTSGLEVLRHWARAVFVNSQLLYREYQPAFRVPVFYTPNGVDTEFYNPALRKEPSSRLRVGWAGSLTNFGPEYKGYYPIVVPAVKALDGAELVTAARENKWRSPDEMREFYRSLDVYVCASRSESTPNPCLEAAACGIPLVTTRVGNMPELVRHGINSLFIERNCDDLTEKLRTLRDSQDLRLSLSENLLKDIPPWDWSLQSQNYRQMFEEMLTAKAGVGQLSTASISSSSAGLVEPVVSPSASVPANLLQVKEELIKKARANLSLLPGSFLREHQRIEVIIVLLSYGRLEMTLNAIRALKDNVLVPFKLLLIDNNSGDEVRTKLTETCAGSGFTELILLDENLGCAGGRYLAFKRATTKYVLLLDNDVEVLPGAIEHLLHQFDLHPDAVGVTGKVVFPDGRIQVCGASFSVDQGIQFIELLGDGRRFDEEIGETGPCDWVPGSLTLSRTDMLQRFPYDQNMRHYFEDNEWCYRINLAGAGKFYRVVEALGIHYHESKAPNPSQPVEESRKQRMKYVETLAYFYQKHNLIYMGLFHFIPELGEPTSQLSISSARIFLELVNSHGAGWVLDRWNDNQLAPLFAAESLQAQLAEKEQVIRNSSAQLAEKEQVIRDSSAQLAEKEQAIRDLSAQLAEKEQAIRDSSAQLAEKEQAIRNFSAQLAEKEQAIRDLSAQVAEKEEAIRDLSAQVAQKEEAIRVAEDERANRVAEREQAIRVFSELSTQVIEKEEAVRAYAAQVADHEQTLRTLSEQVAAKDAELKSATSTLGWRVLRRYGKIKHRYLLPVYRLLRLMPREPKVSNPENIHVV
jgi:GT2 family glycosyltransferase/uncharacterized coiled-coil protein SlyX